MQFEDRVDAGRRLAERLSRQSFVDPVVLGLPRGGVVVAAEVADLLDAPLHAFVAMKIGAPGNPEFGVGAVAEGSDDIVISARRHGISKDEVRSLVPEISAQVRRRAARYRAERPAPDVAGRDVIVVDDGLATGVTALAALRSLRARHPRRLLLAVPVGPPSVIASLTTEADLVTCLYAPAAFFAVGSSYHRFGQTSDEEVMTLLRRNATEKHR